MRGHAGTVLRLIAAAILAILLASDMVLGLMLNIDMPPIVAWLTIPGWYLTDYLPLSTHRNIGLYKLIIMSRWINGIYYFLFIFLVSTVINHLIHGHRPTKLTQKQK